MVRKVPPMQEDFTMKAAKVLYLKKTQTHFGEAMRLNGERDGIRHACAEIAGYIDAHQAAGVYMVDDTNRCV